MLNYYEMNEVLIQAQAGIRIAECHGFLCGQLCVTGACEPDVWHDYLLSNIDDDVQMKACLTTFGEIASVIETQIESPDLDFQPLLPDDEQSLADRSVAVAEWCSGFLGGLGTAGIGKCGAISEDCNEIISDFADITRLGSTDTAGEEGEKALMELIEYLRIGALMLYQELRKAEKIPVETGATQGNH